MTSSDKRITANRANAAQSTGPVTPAGKAVVAGNAVKHGLRGQFHLVAGEDPADFTEFRSLLHAQLEPCGPLEEALAERVITGFWRLRRVERIEVEMIDSMCEDVRRAGESASARGFLPIIVFSDLAAHSSPAPDPEPPPSSLGQAVKRQLQHSDVIGKFHRYEAHIERGLFRALHELQRLQAVRQGRAVPAPVAIDITADLREDR